MSNEIQAQKQTALNCYVAQTTIRPKHDDVEKSPKAVHRNTTYVFLFIELFVDTCTNRRKHVGKSALNLLMNCYHHSYSNQKVTTPMQSKLDRYMKPTSKRLLLNLQSNKERHQDDQDNGQFNSSVENKASTLKFLYPLDTYFDECSSNGDTIDLR